MTIGLPRALLYYRYGQLWETFFAELDCDVVKSPETRQAILAEGVARSEGECCLPLKVFLGHVAHLVGHCDHILVPRFETLGRGEEFCVRFWGLPDIVRNTFPELSLISYNLQGHLPRSEWLGFLSMGRFLGKSFPKILQAYRRACLAQQRVDQQVQARQQALLSSPAPRVLLVSQPYLIHDGFIGAPLVDMIRRQGGVPIFADRCPRLDCRASAAAISSDLYWTLNKELIGAIPLTRPHIDGVLLVSAFPCGSDSLVGELVLRKVRDLPIAQILLDEQQGEAGLQTRIECFMDILHERRQSYAG